MENLRKEDTSNKKENDIVFTKTLKAGKRIYYLDVKKNKKDEFFLAITESKKIISGEDNNPTVQFEKHKIFLYQEDFEKFMRGMNEVVDYIKRAKAGETPSAADTFLEEESQPQEEKSVEEIKLEIDFWEDVRRDAKKIPGVSLRKQPGIFFRFIQQDESHP